MRIHLDLSSLVSRRGLAGCVLLFGAVAVLVLMPGLLGHGVRTAVLSVEDAQPIWLWAAAFGFGAALLGSSLAWRAALALCGGELSPTDAAARYSLGSLVNGLSPARVGEAVRVALFARALDGEDRAWRMGGVFCVVTALRALVFTIVVVAAAAIGALPMWPVLLLAGLVAAAAVAAYASRDRAPRTHVAHLLDAFRSLGRSPRGGARIAGWMALSTCARFAGATAIATALGVHSPLTAALIIVPTLDLAGLIPLSGNVGITSGAVTVALQAHGVGVHQALATGLAFHAVETGAGIAFGAAGAMFLGSRKRVFVLAAAGATACLAAAFCATVIVPLA